MAYRLAPITITASKLGALEAPSGTETITFPSDLTATTGQFVSFVAYKREKGSVQGALRGQKYLNTKLATINLPMPASLPVSYSADYQNEDLGIIGSAVLAGGSALITGAEKTIENAINAAKNPANKTNLEKVSSAAGSVFSDFGGGMASGLSAIGREATNGSLPTAATALAASAGPTAAKAAIADVKGVAANPHRVVLFQGVQFREHQFQYRLSPKSAKESNAIREIIYSFKNFMHPSFGGAAGSSFASRAFLNYPEIFKISFRTDRGSHNHLFSTLPSVLKSFSVQYHPMGYPAYIRTEEEIAPVEVEIQMTFQEIEMVDKGFINTEYSKTQKDVI